MRMIFSGRERQTSLGLLSSIRPWLISFGPGTFLAVRFLFAVSVLCLKSRGIVSGLSSGFAL